MADVPRAGCWLAVLALALGGCRDEGAAEYERAEARYEQLLASGRLAGDAEFDEILRALERIPPGSSARARADALSRAIERARANRAPRPLSREADGAECTLLAEALGRASGAEREAIARRLEACRPQRDDGHAH